jgi:hypothetical protein
MITNWWEDGCGWDIQMVSIWTDLKARIEKFLKYSSKEM